MVERPDPRPNWHAVTHYQEFTITTPGGSPQELPGSVLWICREDSSKLFNIRKITDTFNNNGKIHSTTYDLDTTKQKIIVSDLTLKEGRGSTPDWHGRMVRSSRRPESTNYSYDEQGRLSSVQASTLVTMMPWTGWSAWRMLVETVLTTANDADVLTSICRVTDLCFWQWLQW